MLPHYTWELDVLSGQYVLQLLGYFSIAVAIFLLSYFAARGNLEAAKLLIYVGLILLSNDMLNNIPLSFSIVVEV